jgi:hypothetical protein
VVACCLPTASGRRGDDDAGPNLIEQCQGPVVHISTPPLCYLILSYLGQPPSGYSLHPPFPLICFPVIHSFRCYLSVSHTRPESASEEGEMRSPDPMLPSITFVLSQAQSAAEMRGNKRWGKLGVRRTKSSPSFSPHPPRYPPRLDSEFLTVNIAFPFRTPPLPPFHSSYVCADRESHLFFFLSSLIVTRARRRLITGLQVRLVPRHAQALPWYVQTFIL